MNLLLRQGGSGMPQHITQFLPWFYNHLRGRPLMIWGGGGNQEKKNIRGPFSRKIFLEGLPPGKTSLESTFLKDPSPGKKFQKAFARKKKFISDFSSPAPRSLCLTHHPKT